MVNYGNEIQAKVFQGLLPDTFPYSFEELEEEARQQLDEAPFYYVAGSAGAAKTEQNNRQAFDRRAILPRMLNDVSDRDLSITLFGETFDVPFLLAPIGVQSILHPDAELASAGAAAEMNVPYVASTASEFTLEEIAEVMGDAPKWFQLYWSGDDDVTASLLQRAEKAGYTAIVVTLDTPMLGWRENELKHQYLPFLQGKGIGNYIKDPVFRSKLNKVPEEDMKEAIMYWAKIFGNQSLTWNDIAFLRENTNLPIVLKGILHPGDAELALYHGADGIIVSNHGGRQVDGAIASLDALEKITAVVNKQIPVLMDSGIRRGADVLKAKALGADAVLFGRPYAYGLAIGGREGVKHVIRNLAADIDMTMGLAGEQSIRGLNVSVKNYKSQQDG